MGYSLDQVGFALGWIVFCYAFELIFTLVIHDEPVSTCLKLNIHLLHNKHMKRRCPVHTILPAEYATVSFVELCN